MGASKHAYRVIILSSVLKLTRLSHQLFLYQRGDMKIFDAYTVTWAHCRWNRGDRASRLYCIWTGHRLSWKMPQYCQITCCIFCHSRQLSFLVAVMFPHQTGGNGFRSFDGSVAKSQLECWREIDHVIIMSSWIFFAWCPALFFGVCSVTVLLCISTQGTPPVIYYWSLWYVMYLRNSSNLFFTEPHTPEYWSSNQRWIGIRWPAGVRGCISSRPVLAVTFNTL